MIGDPVLGGLTGLVLTVIFVVMLLIVVVVVVGAKSFSWVGVGAIVVVHGCVGFCSKQDGP